MAASACCAFALFVTPPAVAEDAVVARPPCNAARVVPLEVPVSAPEPCPPEPAAPAPAAPVVLEGVTVTGEKLGRKLKDTATSVNITSNAQLDAYGDESLTDLLRRVGNTTSDGDGDFSIRGISNTGAEGYSRGAQLISVYVDGVALDPAALQGAALDTFDIQQVEVLRGPQSTSQGRNALAGAIVENTQEPTDYWDARARARFGNRDSREYAVAGGGPIGDGLAFRLTGNFTSDDGDVDNVTTGRSDWASVNDRLVRGKLAWTAPLLPAFTTLLTLTQTNRDHGTNTFFEPSDGSTGRREVGNDVRDDLHLRSRLASLRNTYAISPKLDLTATTGYVLTDGATFSDYDQTAQDGGEYSYLQDGHNLTQEIRLNLKQWHGFTGLFGLYGGTFRSAIDYHFMDTVIPLSAVLPLPGAENVTARVDGDSDSHRRAYNLAAFTEMDYRWNERLTFTAGFRYDHEENRVQTLYQITRADSDVQQAPGLPPVNLLPELTAAGLIPASNGIQTARGRFHALLPKAGVRYALTPKMLLFASFAQAYRAGGADVNTSTGGVVSYKPEFTNNYEGGISFSPARGVDVKVNGYYVTWRDQQVLVPTSNGLAYITQNAANSALYGSEVETSWKPTRKISLYASLGYTHTEFLHYVVPSSATSPLGPLAIGPFAPVPNGYDYSGNRFVQAPTFSGSIGGTWKMPFGFYSAASLSEVTGTYSTPANDRAERGNGRQLLDARLGYKNRYFEIFAYGRNLLNQDYDTYRFVRTPGFGTPGGVVTSYGALRRYGLQIEAKY